MTLIGIVLIVAGVLFCLGGWITILSVAFKQSFLTGIGCFFIPLILLIFALWRFRDTKGGLGAYAVGWILIVLGLALGSDGPPS